MRRLHQGLRAPPDGLKPAASFDNKYNILTSIKSQKPATPMTRTAITPADIETAYLHRMAKLDLMPIEQLKRLWDQYDGDNSPDGYEGEEIHLALNLRGHGSYCPV